MDEKVLLNVELNAKEALESYAKIKIRVDELRESQKKLKAAGLENSQVYIETEQQIKALNKRAQEYQKTIQQNVKLEHEQAGSLQQLKAQLSLWTQEYNKLSETERRSQAGLQMAKNIAEITRNLTDAEVELGNFHRQVGNYELASKALKKEMADLTAKLQVMRVNQEQNSEEYRVAADRLAEIKDALGKVNQEITQLGNDTKNLEAMSQALGTLSQSMNLLVIMTREVGLGVPELQDVLSKLGVTITALSAIMNIYTATAQKSIASRMVILALEKATITQEQRLAKAEAKKAAAQSASNIITKAATAAQWAWNAALAANPLGVIIIAITALIALGAGLIHFFGSTSKATEEASIASEKYEQQARRTAAAISEINAQSQKEVDEISNAMRKEIVEMKKRGATEQEIADYRLKKEREIRNAEFSASLDRQVEHEQELKAKKAELQAQEKVLATISKFRKKYKEQKAAVEELRKAYKELENTAYQEEQKREDILIKNTEAEQQAAEERKKLQRKNASDQAELQKQVADNTLKAQKHSEELALDIADASQAERFANSQKWEKTMFDANQAYEKRKLARQKKNGEITQQEYNNQLAKLAESERAFLEDQAANAKKEVLRQYKEVISAVGQQTEQMLQKVDSNLASNLAAVSGQLGIDDEFKTQYDNFAALMEMYKQQQEEFEKTGFLALNASGATMEADKKRFDEMQQKMFEYYRIERELKAQAEEEKTAIEQAAVDKRLARALKAIEDENALDLLDYTKTQEEKNNILIEQSKKRIEAYKKEVEAETDPKVRLELLKKIAEEENTMRELNLQNVQIAAGKELANVTLTAMQKFKIKEAYLKQELDAVRGNAEAEAEINAQLLENRQETLNAIADGISEWGGKAVDAANQISSLMSNIEQRQLDEFEEKQNKQKSALQDRLDAGLISQEEYDASVARLDAELEKKQKEIEIKQAKRNKAIALMEAAINIATAITKAVAESPMTGGLPGSAIAATLGAIQIATIAAEPLPKASRGALLQGPSHAQGGIPIEAEGGEAIINKRSTSRFLPLLSAINQAGGGVPLFANGGLVRQAQQQSQQLIDYRAFAEIMSKVQIRSQVAVTDINRGQANYVKVESLRSF